MLRNLEWRQSKGHLTLEQEDSILHPSKYVLLPLLLLIRENECSFHHHQNQHYKVCRHIH
jgi:hypothetical protein